MFDNDSPSSEEPKSNQTRRGGIKLRVSRKQQESVISVIKSIADNLSEKLLSIDTEKSIEAAVCKKCNIDPEIFQGVYQFWVNSSEYISASYLINEFERSLGTTACLISENKYRNCIRLGERKGLSSSESTEFVNIYITKHSMQLEKEVYQEVDNFVGTWCSRNLSGKKYAEQDIKKLTKLVTESFPALKANRIKRSIDNYLTRNNYKLKKGLFGLGIAGL